MAGRVSILATQLEELPSFALEQLGEAAVMRPALAVVKKPSIAAASATTRPRPKTAHRILSDAVPVTLRPTSAGMTTPPVIVISRSHLYHRCVLAALPSAQRT
jgi:hypothetical protein